MEGVKGIKRLFTCRKIRVLKSKIDKVFYQVRQGHTHQIELELFLSKDSTKN